MNFEYTVVFTTSKIEKKTKFKSISLLCFENWIYGYLFVTYRQYLLVKLIKYLWITVMSSAKYVTIFLSSKLSLLFLLVY